MQIDRRKECAAYVKTCGTYKDCSHYTYYQYQPIIRINRFRPYEFNFFRIYYGQV